MPDAEKIIAAALQTVSDTSRTASVVAAALREAGMLTETEWEYGVRIGSFGLAPAQTEGHAKSMLSDIRYETGKPIRRRKPGPWEPVEGDPR